MVPRLWAREVAELVRDAAVVTIDGGAHAVQYSQPEAVAEASRRFVRNVVFAEPLATLIGDRFTPSERERYVPYGLPGE